MSKLNEKKKSRSGVEKTKIKQMQHAQEKLHLLKASKQEELKERKKNKLKETNEDNKNALDRFKKKVKK